MSFRTPLEKLPEVFGKEKNHPWWDGRQVAIRPDVPGSDVDPGDLVLVETENERTEMNVRIDRSMGQEAEVPDEELWPDWLAPRDTAVNDLALNDTDPDV
jgi:hypothetical protein